MRTIGEAFHCAPICLNSPASSKIPKTFATFPFSMWMTLAATVMGRPLGGTPKKGAGVDALQQKADSDAVFGAEHVEDGVMDAVERGVVIMPE